MVKLALLLALASLACRRWTGRWPWAFLDTDGGEAGRARKLLGIGAEASREDILAAHRRLLIAVHPDRGGSAAQVHAADAARDLLLTRLGRADRAA
jgi:hypothetical protein